MKSPRARKFMDDAVSRASRRSGGHLPSPMLLSAAHSTDIAVADRSALPVIPNDAPLMTSDGKPLFLIGYSAMGGGDVMG